MSGELHKLLLLNYNLLVFKGLNLGLFLLILSGKTKILTLKSPDASVNLYQNSFKLIPNYSWFLDFFIITVFNYSRLNSLTTTICTISHDS